MSSSSLLLSSPPIIAEDWAPTPLAEIRAKHLRKQAERHEDPPPPLLSSSSCPMDQDQQQQQQLPTQQSAAPGMSQPLRQQTSSSSIQQQQQQPAMMQQSSMQLQQHQQSVLQQMQRVALLQQQSAMQQPSQQQQQHAMLQQQLNSMQAMQQQQQQQPSMTMEVAQQLRQYHMQLQQQQQQAPTRRPEANAPAAAAAAKQQLMLQQQLQQQQQQQQNHLDDNASAVSTSSSASTMTAAQQQQHQSALSLPSTVMPPSVLTSILPLGAGATRNKAAATYRKRNATTNKSTRVESPQDVLERMTALRGYRFSNSKASTVMRIKADDACYDTVPSPLQLASFGTELVKAIHISDVEKLGRLLGAGLSPNPCNQFRDSIVDLVCKRANASVFRCLVEHGCDLRVCDGFGRTPLHHCCWASEFSADIASIILKTDPQQLFMEDKRGQTPLEYVRPDQAVPWIDFLETNVSTLFPQGGSLPPIVSLKLARENGQLPDPANALPVQLASAISSGSITPEALSQMDPALRARFI